MAYADADQTEVVADGSTSFSHFVQGMVGTTDAGVPRAYVRTPDGMPLATEAARNLAIDAPRR